MINVDGELPVPFADAATLVPPDGVDRGTISRWASIGIKGVILKSWKIGGRRYTSRESLARFLDECNLRGTLGYKASAWSERVLTAQQRREVQAVTDGESTGGKLSHRAKNRDNAQPDAGESIRDRGPVP